MYEVFFASLLTQILQNAEFHTCTISDIQIAGPEVKLFKIKYPHAVQFQSGQFIIIDFGNLEHTFNTRSYSISDFTADNEIEICVVLKEDGAATPLLFDMPVGTKLTCSNPQGRFVLPDEISPDVRLVFICTGTGVAPFRAMIKDILFHRKLENSISLYFGCRKRENALYYDEFKQYAHQFDRFNYYPVFSREDKNQDIKTGYVHPYYLEELGAKPSALIYICGWTEMVKESRDNLKELGYTRKEIKVEFYD